MATFEVYTTGGGYYVYDIMNYLAIFSSGNMFADMMTVGITIGVLFSVIRMVLYGNMQGTMQYVALVAIVGALGVGPKARVIIKDTTYPLEYYAAVDNVPFSVAMVAHYTTSASYHISRRMEALLSTPNELTYQRHGMLFGATLMSQAARWRATTATFSNSLVNFMESCMVDGTNIGLVDLDELVKTGDLPAFLSVASPASLAYYDEDSGNVVNCSDGWPGLENQLNDEVNKLLKVKAASLSKTNPSGSSSIDVSSLSGTLNQFQNLMGMAGYDSTRLLKQTMLIRALDDAQGRLLANSGNSAAMTLYQSARADLQTQSSYQAVGINATKWVPLIKVAFETLYYGAFPLALFLMFTPLSLMVIRGYFSGFVWLAAWEPLSAILHTTLLKSATGFYREHTTTLSGTTTEEVLNWANHFGVRAVEQEIGTVAGYLMMSVPFLSFAIFFGATRMAGLATSMLNVSQGAAIDTGREAATGNIQSGNISMNNMNANKWNTSAMRDTGRSSYTLADGAVATTNADGSQTLSSGTSQSNVGLSVNYGQAMRGEISERLSQANRLVQTESNDYAESVTTAASRYSDFIKSASENLSSGGEKSASTSQEARESYSDSMRQVKEFSQRHGLDTKTALTAMMMGSLGGKLGIGLEASLNGKIDAAESENFQQAVNDASTKDYSSLFSDLDAASSRVYVSGTHGNAQSGSEGVKSAYDEVKTHASRLHDAYETTEALEKADSFVRTQDAATQSKLTDAFSGLLRGAGYSEDDISRVLNPKTATGAKLQQEVLDQYLPQLMKQVGINIPEVGPGPTGLTEVTDHGLKYQKLDTDEARETTSMPDVGKYQSVREGVEKAHEGISTPVKNNVANSRDNSATRQNAGRETVTEKLNQGVASSFGENADEALQDVGSLVTNMASNLFGGNQKPEPQTAPQAGMPSSMALQQTGLYAGVPTQLYPTSIGTGITGPRGGQIDRHGYYTADNIRYDIGPRTIRDDPVDSTIMARLSNIVGNMGSEYGIVVTSGGQPSEGTDGVDRTGSHRHDHGGAVDFYLTRNGQRVNPNEDKQLYSELIERSAPYFSGIGHYDWGVHMGGGEQAFWGPNTKNNTADKDFQSAYWRGRVGS